MNGWLRPLRWFEGGSSEVDENTGARLPAMMGGPFPGDVTAICTGAFGPRVPIVLPDGSRTSPFHTGTDWWNVGWSNGTIPLLSLVHGTVEFADTRPDVGNWIRVREAGGRYAVDYYHLDQPAEVAVGETVAMGRRVGHVGTSGYSTGPHLHLQIIDTTSPADPLPLLRDAPLIGAVGTIVGQAEYSTDGQALVVFAGGTSAQLEDACRNAAAKGAWVQDATGEYRLLIVDGPPNLRAEFDAAFPAGIQGPASIVLVRA